MCARDKSNPLRIYCVNPCRAPDVCLKASRLTVIAKPNKFYNSSQNDTNTTSPPLEAAFLCARDKSNPLRIYCVNPCRAPDVCLKASRLTVIAKPNKFYNSSQNDTNTTSPPLETPFLCARDKSNFPRVTPSRFAKQSRVRPRMFGERKTLGCDKTKEVT